MYGALIACAHSQGVYTVTTPKPVTGILEQTYLTLINKLQLL